jgi:hypothetical protein
MGADSELALREISESWLHCMYQYFYPRGIPVKSMTSAGRASVEASGHQLDGPRGSSCQCVLALPFRALQYKTTQLGLLFELVVMLQSSL